MSETRVIQLTGAALGVALAILIAPIVPLYMAGVTAAQAWFISVLLGVSVAWSAVEFLPPLLGEEGEPVNWTIPAVTLPSFGKLLPSRVFLHIASKRYSQPNFSTLYQSKQGVSFHYHLMSHYF